MSDNLKLWEAVRRPPEEALKAFKRSGGFGGTAIKPMWSIKAMTEQFGPCGEGWGMNEPQFNVQPVGNEILVYCTVSIWHTKRENVVFGVGGDKVLVQQSSGLRSDDEAFKKAFTDAITNALKHLGVGADIHMGLWDGSKYAVDEHQEATVQMLPKAHSPATGPTKSASMDGKNELCSEIHAFARVKDLEAWGTDYSTKDRIAALHDDHKETVRNSYIEKMNELKASLAA